MLIIRPTYVANVYAVLPFYNVKCLCSGSSISSHLKPRTRVLKWLHYVIKQNIWQLWHLSKKGFKIDVTRIVDLWRNKIESKCNSGVACRPYDAIQEKMKEKERHMAIKCSYAFIGLTWIWIFMDVSHALGWPFV